ncbi:hypothetical protein QEN19_002111 [Hanseniaspora menglaensis]
MIAVSSLNTFKHKCANLMYIRTVSNLSNSAWTNISSPQNISLLKKQYQFKTFKQTISFINESLVPITKRLKHHPKIIVEYNKLTIELTTHDSPHNNNISELDHLFAKDLDIAFEAFSK